MLRSVHNVDENEQIYPAEEPKAQSLYDIYSLCGGITQSFSFPSASGVVSD
jgi:hypothetical protein